MATVAVPAAPLATILINPQSPVIVEYAAIDMF
jgi:hypothetical protein